MLAPLSGKSVSEAKHSTEVAVIGGGLAGIAAAIELLDHDKSVLIVDRDSKASLGGLARLAFGGMCIVGTPIQKFHGVKDAPDLALKDWLTAARFGEEDVWPRRWAEMYVHRSLDDIYRWLVDRGVNFFPVPHWVERGEFAPGNSVPRYHIIWGTGEHLMNVMVSHLYAHRNASKLKVLFEHRVESLETTNGRPSGCVGVREDTGERFEIQSDAVIVASGGINGDLDRVRRHWDRRYGDPPKTLLNGAHPYADGKLHDAVENIGGNVTHLDWQWNYAAGIRHPTPRMEHEGLSIIPPKSALWMDCRGRRVGPVPLMSGYDTLDLCRRIAQLEHGYTWQVMNWKIATKELAISGAESNAKIRDRKPLAFILSTLRGNTQLIQWMIDECEDVVAGRSLGELTEKMNAVTGEGLVDRDTLEDSVRRYDEQFDRPLALRNDDQIRRVLLARKWKGDRARLCNMQRIVDEKAMPLIAIREFIVSRKSQGGIQTDLESRVLSPAGDVVPGLYAAGEAAGFGGGGINGAGSLEGTYMSNCILNGRIAARSIAGVPNP